MSFAESLTDQLTNELNSGSSLKHFSSFLYSSREIHVSNEQVGVHLEIKSSFAMKSYNSSTHPDIEHYSQLYFENKSCNS